MGRQREQPPGERPLDACGRRLAPGVLVLAAMKIQVLMSPGCGHGLRTAELVAEIVRTHSLNAETVTILVESLEEATRLAFPGSPTVRVDGVDVEPQPPASVGLG